ncbi:MAG: FAD-binding oxidoreductase [Cyclobacteriaceae bacterium]|nr:FAD-binding oxidoreductase [Cyclobacteriaceae bacterium]
MDLRSSYPFWLLNNGIIATYPSLSKNSRTQVAILGAGITGALVAWHLCKKGFDVIIVDKRHVGMGSTAASTALLQYEIDTPLHKLAEIVGERNAARSYKLCINSIYEIEKICKELKTDVGFSLKESFQYASTKKDSRDLEKEFAIRKKHGIDLKWLTEKDIKTKFGFYAPAGLLSSEGAQIDAYRFTHAILAHIAATGRLQVFDATEVLDIKHHRNTVTLSTSLGTTITANHLVIASGYESQKYLPKKVEEFHSTYAIVSEPFSENKFWYHNSLIWETATPYLYLRTTDDNRILIGGKDDEFSSAFKRDSALPGKAKALEKSFNKLFPNIPFKTDFQWAGTFAITKDGLPFIGSVRQRPATSFALGFGGNGITFSVIAAQMIRDKLMGKVNKDELIFSFNR